MPTKFKEEYICEHCGIKFQAKQKRVYRFCSKSCATKSTKFRTDRELKIRNKVELQLYYRISKGEIKKRNSCEICHASPSVCHHDDYTKPFEFIELCSKCHNILHAQYEKQGIDLLLNV